jgi:hypothetical protein
MTTKTKIILIGVLLLLVVSWVIYKRKQLQYEIYSAMGIIRNYKGGSSWLDSSYPRGIRNNNPGNLIITSIPWRDKVPVDQNTDGHFEQFYKFEYGVRALIKDLQSDYKKGLNTIRKLINEYAPNHENNTEAYVNYVANGVGILPDATLYSLDKSVIEQMVFAIDRMENGGSYITSTHFNDAWEIV